MVKTTFEDIKKALWAGANTFRDNIDAANYKDYVLSMFFVKYLSDTYKESVEELEKEYSGIRLERQIENLPFYLKKEHTFQIVVLLICIKLLKRLQIIILMVMFVLTTVG